MSGFQDYSPCPNCSNKMALEFLNIKTNESEIFCRRCGYHEEYFIANLETMNSDKQWKPKYEHKVEICKDLTPKFYIF